MSSLLEETAELFLQTGGQNWFYITVCNLHHGGCSVRILRFPLGLKDGSDTAQACSHSAQDDHTQLKLKHQLLASRDKHGTSEREINPESMGIYLRQTPSMSSYRKINTPQICIYEM